MTITLEHYQWNMKEYLYLDFMENPVSIDEEWLDWIAKRSWALGVEGLLVGVFYHQGEKYVRFYPFYTESAKEDVCKCGKERFRQIFIRHEVSGDWQPEHVGTMRLYDRFLA